MIRPIILSRIPRDIINDSITGFLEKMRSTKAIIDLKRLEHNYNFVRDSAPDSKLMAVVKANAYGHGMIPISAKLRQLGVDFLGVAFADEGAALRNAGDRGDIFVMAPICAPDEIDTIVENDLHSAASTTEYIEMLNNAAIKKGKKAKIHLFIDTGMHRDGVLPENALATMNKTKEFKGVEIAGACTHFASSSLNKEFSYRQLALFNRTISELQVAGFNFPLLHAANSGGFANVPESRLNMIRVGFALYGYAPDESVAEKYDVQPILELKSEVVAVRRVKKDECVGYDFLYTAPRDVNVATVPTGYGDGYFKTLGNKAYCICKGKLRPVIGSVCMDEIMIDCSNDDVKPGDEVVLIGEDGREFISANTVATWAGTIPYEATTNLSARVPRIYKD